MHCRSLDRENIDVRLPHASTGTDSLEKVAQGSKMLRSFTVASAFTDLRNTSKLYFANRANHLYPSGSSQRTRACRVRCV